MAAYILQPGRHGFDKLRLKHFTASSSSCSWCFSSSCCCPVAACPGRTSLSAGSEHANTTSRKEAETERQLTWFQNGFMVATWRRRTWTWETQCKRWLMVEQQQQQEEQEGGKRSWRREWINKSAPPQPGARGLTFCAIIPWFFINTWPNWTAPCSRSFNS